jgi:hypothetical protein
VPNETLSIVLEAVGADKLVANLEAAAKGSEDAGLAEQKRAADTLTAAAADDKATLALAKLNLERAKQAGGGGTGSAEQLAVSAANDKSRLSALEASAAQRTYKADTLAAAAAAQTAAEGQTGLAGALSKVGLSGALATPAVASMGLAIAGLAAFDVIKSGLNDFIDLTNQVRQFSQVTGASAEESSLFVGQMQALGINSAAADKAFSTFGASIGAGTDKLAQYGIQIAHNQQGQVDLVGTLGNVRAAYQGSTDASTKDAIAKQLSARGATDLLPLLNATDAQINQINADTKNRGDIFSGQDLNNAAQFQVATKELSASVKAFEIELAKGLVPILTTVVSGLTTIIDDANKLGQVKVFGQSLFGDLAAAISPAIGLLDLFGGKSDKAAQEQAKLAVAAQAAADAITKEKTAEDSLQSTLLSDVSASQSLASAKQNVTDAVKAHNDAVTAEQSLVNGGLAGYSNYISAQKQLESAQRSATSATEAEESAQDNLAKALQHSTDLQLAQAQAKIDQSGDKIVSAQLAVTTAKEKLDALLGSGSASADEIAAAEAAVKAAVDQVTQSQLDQKQATLDLATAKQKGTQADPAVQDAEQRLTDAHRTAVDALQAVKDAQDVVTTATSDYGKAVTAAKALVDTSAADIKQKQMDVQLATLQSADAAQKLSDTIASTSGQAYENVKAKLEGLAPSYAKILGDAQALNTYLGALANPTGPSASQSISSVLNPLGTNPLPPVIGGLDSFFPPTATGVAPSGAVTNVTVYAQTNASATDIAREVSWTLNTTPAPTPHR